VVIHVIMQNGNLGSVEELGNIDEIGCKLRSLTLTK